MEIENFVFFTSFGECLPIAYKLSQMGKNVIAAQVSDLKHITLPGKPFKPEPTEERRRRLMQYNGMLNKVSAESIMPQLLRNKRPEKWFCFFDLNSLFKFSEPLAKAGYMGNFPTQEDYEYEFDRNKAKEFVRENYKGLRVAEEEEFKKIDDAKSFLEDTDEVWVLKGYHVDAKTVVSNSDDPELAKLELIESLENGKELYEKGGFILERKIINPIEFTPQVVFYDGELVWADIDIETKYIGDGNVGYQVGCGTNLVFQVSPDNPIVKKAFPQVIFDMAKQHKGIWVIDAGILCEQETMDLYFTEFCYSRFGFDSLFAELSMSRGVDQFFNDIVDSKNPIVRNDGVSVRLFNLPNSAPYQYAVDDNGYAKRPNQFNDLNDKEITIEVWDNIFPYDIYKKNGKYLTTGFGLDLAVVTGAGENIDDAVDRCYEELKFYNCSGYYCRSKDDFMSGSYTTSIMNRYDFLEKRLKILE